MITETKRLAAIEKLGGGPRVVTMVDALIELFKDDGVEKYELKSDEINVCRDAWSGTLKAFGIERPVLPHENVIIAQLIQQRGYKAVAHCLMGMRLEEKTNSFNPRKNVAISRAHDMKLFEKFVNLASQKRTEDKKNDLRATLP